MKERGSERAQQTKRRVLTGFGELQQHSTSGGLLLVMGEGEIFKARRGKANEQEDRGRQAAGQQQ